MMRTARAFTLSSLPAAGGVPEPLRAPTSRPKDTAPAVTLADGT